MPLFFRFFRVWVDGEEIQATPEPPFYLPEEGRVSAKDLEAGDKVETADEKEATVDRGERKELEELVNVYNFDAMDYHTYYAGENGVLVHNMCNTAKNTAAEAAETLADAVNKSGSKTGPNPNGRKGGVAHQSVIEDIKTDADKRGLTYDR